MATAQVSTLEEFITAIAVQGDTVICPEGAVWDANDVYPDGYTGDIAWKAHVQGNGTTIKNLRLYGYFYTDTSASRVQISSLRLIDLIGSRSTYYFKQALFYGNYKFEDFTATAVLNSAYPFFCNPKDDSSFSYQTQANRCSFNIDASGNFTIFSDGYTTNNSGHIYNSRIELHLPNSTHAPFGNSMRFYNCELIAYAPNISGTSVDSRMWSLYCMGCVIHGEMPTVRERASSGTMQGDMTIYSTDAMPDFVPVDPIHFVGVTDAQLRDPSYLRGIGFPIAIEV